MVLAGRANKISALLSLVFLSCGSGQEIVRRSPAPTPPPPPAATSAPAPPPAPPKKSDLFAVATENEDAANVAVHVSLHGGNAFDAAVAAVLVAGVTQPASTGIGGDGFAVAWSGSEKKASYIDFRARAPVSLKSKEHLGKAQPEKKRGVMVGVPGVVAGLFELHEGRGKLPWADLVKLAADQADEGFVVSPYMAQALAWLGEDPLGRPVLTALGVEGDPSSLAGKKLTNPALAGTLRSIADGGPRAFYEGPVARDVLDAVLAAGGSIAPSDLSSYGAIARDAFTVQWGGFDVVTASQPSGGGFVVGELLGLFAPREIEELGFGTAPYVHMLSEGFRQAADDRAWAIGDPAFTKMDPTDLLTPDRMKEQRATFHLDSTTMPRRASARDKGTFHLVVVDEGDDVVSITTTMTSLFGAKVVTKGGFALNDALTDFAMDDYGLKIANRGPNYPRGGARPASSMAPVIVVKDGSVVCALGASGGYRIPAAVTEVLFDHLVFGRSVTDAVAAPRFETSPTGTLLLEAGLASLAGDLRARGEILEERPSDFSAVSAIAVKRDGSVRTLEAAADPRKRGAERVVQAGQ